VERPQTSTITAEIKPRKEVISIEIRFKKNIAPKISLS